MLHLWRWLGRRRRMMRLFSALRRFGFGLVPLDELFFLGGPEQLDMPVVLGRPHRGRSEPRRPPSWPPSRQYCASMLEVAGTAVAAKEDQAMGWQNG